MSEIDFKISFYVIMGMTKHGDGSFVSMLVEADRDIKPDLWFVQISRITAVLASMISGIVKQKNRPRVSSEGEIISESFDIPCL